VKRRAAKGAIVSTSRAAEAELSKTIILDSTETLMVEEGYAAVSTRRVAAKAGLKPPLVHYYYKTTDDLLLAVYGRQSDRAMQSLKEALASEGPLTAIWRFNAERSRTALALEFMALANHRKVIRDEIAARAEAFRTVQAEALASLLREVEVPPDIRMPQALTLCMAGVARALVMEEGLGIHDGHEDAEALVAWLIRRLERPSEQDR
jgi:AcrR family transcriptional regulator